MPINWDSYNSILTVDGTTYRDRVINKTERSISKRASRSPAYKTVLIDDKEQDVVITSAAELYNKKINALPNEHLYAGSIVLWNKRHWLITYVDCEDEIYQRATMSECNVYLKWQNEKGEIIGRYGFSEDIAMYAAGIVNGKILNSLEMNLKIQFPMDKETVVLRRDKRFLMDVLTDEPNAYVLTNRNVITMNFNPTDVNEDYEFEGHDKIVLLTFSQTQLSERDNRKLMIADYFVPDEPAPEPTINECKIVYKGKPEIKMGGNFKTFDVIFYDINKAEVTIPHTWKITTEDGLDDKFITETSGTAIKIKAPDLEELLNTQIKLEIMAAGYEASLFIKVVSLYG